MGLGEKHDTQRPMAPGADDMYSAPTVVQKATPELLDALAKVRKQGAPPAPRGGEQGNENPTARKIEAAKPVPEFAAGLPGASAGPSVPSPPQPNGAEVTAPAAQLPLPETPPPSAPVEASHQQAPASLPKPTAPTPQTTKTRPPLIPLLVAGAVGVGIGAAILAWRLMA